MQSTPFAIRPAYPSPVRFLVQLLAAIAAFNTGAVARAQEWGRYHVGIAVGPEPHLSPPPGPASIPEPLWGTVDSSTGWKVVAGFRPIRIVGAEIQYVDFGTAVAEARSTTGRVPAQLIEMKARANATVLTAILFIPEPSPSFDVYGKIGVAQLVESVTVQGYDAISTGCRPAPAIPTCRYDSDVETTDAHPYLGIGARFKEVGRAWAVRVEYEEIAGDGPDNTTMLSVGVAWER